MWAWYDHISVTQTLLRFPSYIPGYHPRQQSEPPAVPADPRGTRIYRQCPGLRASVAPRLRTAATDCCRLLRQLRQSLRDQEVRPRTSRLAHQAPLRVPDLGVPQRRRQTAVRRLLPRQRLLQGLVLREVHLREAATKQRRQIQVRHRRLHLQLLAMLAAVPLAVFVLVSPVIWVRTLRRETYRDELTLV